MPMDEIQTENPGSVSNGLASRVMVCSPDDGPYNQLPGVTFLLAPRRNIPAYLASALGILAVALVLIGLFAQHYEPRWIGPLWVVLPAGGWFGSLLGVPTLFLGAAGALQSYHQAADGQLWAWIGIFLGVCAMLGALALFLELMSHITGC